MRVAALDDDATQLELIQRTLAAMGHDCHGFSDSRACLRSLRRESYDLLVLDWQLPDISGLEVLRWARENLQERVPVLFITNRSAESDVIEGLSAGADDFMTKPMRVGELVARMIHRGADLDLQERRGVSALHAAAMHGMRDIAERLLKAGADARRRDSLARTAHEVAVLLGYVDLAALLKRD